MTPADAAVILRVVPPQFRGPAFSFVRNNVYQQVAGPGGKATRQLVGQLQDAAPTRLPVDQVARFFGGGGQVALQALSAVGSVASIANLGVCVVGFIHVSRGIRRIEARLERVEQKVDAIAELVGVVDQKVDQLQELAVEHHKALSALHALMLSFQTARVHRALETLEFRCAGTGPRRDTSEIMAAAAILHEYRLWLSQTRLADPGRALPATAELLRAETLVAIAEGRARCLVGDAGFAALELESVLAGVRAEADRMRSRIGSEGGIASLLSCNVQGVEDTHREAVEAWSWLDRTSDRRSQRVLLRETTHAYNQLSQRMRTVGNYMTAPAPSVAHLSALVEQRFYEVPMTPDADAASLILAVRLGRNLESALAMCTAVEVLGDAARPLLEAKEPGTSAALCVELVEWQEVGR